MSDLEKMRAVAQDQADLWGAHTKPGKCARMVLAALDTLHTYASENADSYTYDDGVYDGVREVLSRMNKARMNKAMEKLDD